jgi:hypothetical protein
MPDIKPGITMKTYPHLSKSEKMGVLRRPERLNIINISLINPINVTHQLKKCHKKY